MFLLSTDELEFFQLFSMLGAGRDQVDSGRREARVAEDIGEFDDVVGLVVEGLGKKVAEVVGEDFPGWTPACLQRAFISAQICFRLMGFRFW